MINETVHVTAKHFKTLNKTLILSGKKWDNVSGEAKDLLGKLLMKDPEQRITIQNALMHSLFAIVKYN